MKPRLCGSGRRQPSSLPPPPTRRCAICITNAAEGRRRMRKLGLREVEAERRLTPSLPSLGGEASSSYPTYESVSFLLRLTSGSTRRRGGGEASLGVRRPFPRTNDPFPPIRLLVAAAEASLFAPPPKARRRRRLTRLPPNCICPEKEEGGGGGEGLYCWGYVSWGRFIYNVLRERPFPGRKGGRRGFNRQSF